MEYSLNLSANSISDSWSGRIFSLLLLTIESISLKRDLGAFELSDIRSERYFVWASLTSLSYFFFCALKHSLSSVSFETLHFHSYFLFLPYLCISMVISFLHLQPSLSKAHVCPLFSRVSYHIPQPCSPYQMVRSEQWYQKVNSYVLCECTNINRFIISGFDILSP